MSPSPRPESTLKYRGDTETDAGGETTQDKGKSRASPFPPLPIPAVKGTIGGIESPRRSQFSPSYVGRGHTRDSSFSTLTSQIHGPTASSPTLSTGTATPGSSRPALTPAGPAGPSPQPGPERDRPVFRADPTMKSCFDSLKLDAKDQIKTLFQV